MIIIPLLSDPFHKITLLAKKKSVACNFSTLCIVKRSETSQKQKILDYEKNHVFNADSHRHHDIMQGNEDYRRLAIAIGYYH